MMSQIHVACKHIVCNQLKQWYVQLTGVRMYLRQLIDKIYCWYGWHMQIIGVIISRGCYEPSEAFW